jgi:two-component system phosphate regulon sensor histidine kinase PhoR
MPEGPCSWHKCAVNDHGPLPRSAACLIAAVDVAGAAFLALRAPEVAHWNVKDLVTWAALAAAILVAEQFQIPIRHRAERLNLSLTEALWVGALLLAKPSVLTVAMASGLLGGQLIRRWPRYKVAFNVGQYLVALSIAQLLFARLNPTHSLAPGAWLLAALSMVAYAVVNATLVALVISRVSNKPFSSILVPSLPVNALHFVANIALGLEGAVIWALSPMSVPLLAAPMFLAYTGYRTLVRTLREHDRMRSVIVENASDGIFLATSDGRIVSWNPAMERITGFPSAEAVGCEWRQMLSLGPVMDERADVAISDHGATVTAPIARKDGTTVWIRYFSSDIRIPDDQLEGQVVVVHDVTAEREAEQLKTDFVATISHELRTPLTPLKGFLSTLMNGTAEDSPEARQEYYRIMLKQANRLERLITDLLEVSRVESGTSLIDAKVMDLAGPVAEQVRLFQEQYPERRISLCVPASPVMVSADHSPLGLVTSNLISNAIKYSPPDGAVEVMVTTTASDAVVSVSDQGEGIPLAEHARVFDRFYQVASAHTRTAGGIGLGLYIARRLIEAMSGRIWVNSASGAGSTFCYSLPLVAQDQGDGQVLAFRKPDPVHRPAAGQQVRS